MPLPFTVVYAKDMAATKRFYELLGLRFAEEKHGNGPVHYAAHIDDGVFEIYPLTDPAKLAKQPKRLKFAIRNIADVIMSLEKEGTEIVSMSSRNTSIQHAVVRDPDGRLVELEAVRR